MEERTIKLTLEKAKEFYQKGGELRNIALSAFTEEELTEVELPKTWKEFCENNPIKEKEYFIDECCSIIELESKNQTRSSSIDRNLLSSEEAAETHLALMQLHQLRDCYRQGWIPDYTNDSKKWSVTKCDNDISVGWSYSNMAFLSFQTKEIAEEFLNNFRDLIKQAGDLI